jgi:outer membrane protein assembly factor BamB
MKARVAFVVAGILLAVGFQAHAAAPPGCADPTAKPGEWRTYGGTADNARFQRAESVLSTGSVANIAKAWVLDLSKVEYVDPTTGQVRDLLSAGEFQNTPVIADGCLYLATSSGWVMAFNADKDPSIGANAGKQRALWATHLEGGGLSLRSSVITGSPTVENGIVYVGVTLPGAPASGTNPAVGPYVAAMDQATGRVLWTTVVDAGQRDTGIAATPVYFDGMIFQGFYGSEGTFPNNGAPVQIPPARGGYAILDASATCDPALFVAPSKCFNVAPGATGGSILKHEYTITDAEYAAGYRGASVWCTAAYDPETKYIYACGGNPSNPKLESRYANALLKIDGDRARASSFGTIVDSYKGNTDQFYPGLDRQPACDLLGDRITAIWSQPCGQLDLDFGSSPSLFKVKIGSGTTFETRTVVGDLQKSGVYHAVWADQMTPMWTAQVGTPCPACNAGSPAVDLNAEGFVDGVYTVATAPGQLWALDGNTGRYRWVEPILGGTHFQSTTAANGVVYTIDNLGTLGIFDAETGLPIARRPLSLDVGDSAQNSSSQGIAVARNTIYVPASRFLVVLR